MRVDKLEFGLQARFDVASYYYLVCVCSNKWIESWANRLYLEMFLYDRYSWGLDYEVILLYV